MSLQLLISGCLAMVWLALAVYLLVLHRGPEQWWHLNTRLMGLAALLLGVWNLARLVLEWQRLRRDRRP